MLQIKDMSCSIIDSDISILDHFSLTMKEGEVHAIMGPNGTGKSTLARYLAGINRPGLIGQILINGLDPFSELDGGKIRRMVGICFQDPRMGMVFENVGREMVFGAENIGIPKDVVTKRASYYLRRFNLRKMQSSHYSTISGSEESSLAVSAVLMMKPEILIMDEPFSMHFEEDANRFIDEIIRDAKRKGQTVIFFSKNRYVMERVDRAYELTEGRLYEIDAYGMPHSSSEDEKVEFDIIRTGSHFTRGRYIDVNHKISVERFIHGDDAKSENGISLHNVSFGYDDKLILDNINARYLAGSAYRITGAPASGKTTYLQIIGGLLTPFEGEIFLKEGSRIGYVFQYSEDGFVENTVLDDVMFGPMSDGVPKSTARDMAISVLEFVGVSDTLWGKSPLSLSMGEQRLVSIAGALALDPDFLLIDEPYLGLDIETRRHIEEIITALCQIGKCVITVES